MRERDAGPRRLRESEAKPTDAPENEPTHHREHRIAKAPSRVSGCWPIPSSTASAPSAQPRTHEATTSRSAQSTTSPATQRKSCPSSHMGTLRRASGVAGARATTSPGGAAQSWTAAPARPTTTSKPSTAHPWSHDATTSHGHAHAPSGPRQGCAIEARRETSTLPSTHRASPSGQSMASTAAPGFDRDAARGPPRPRSWSHLHAQPRSQPATSPASAKSTHAWRARTAD
jgi:hypothetical protein